MSVAAQPSRRSPSAVSRKPVRRRLRAANASPAPKSSRLKARATELLETEIGFVPNDAFVGLRDSDEELSTLAAGVEAGTALFEEPLGAGLPVHLSRMCATPLLSPEEERELFRRMNFCKYRANALRSRLSRRNPDADKVREIDDYLRRAERLRNHIIQANVRLVMSIARKFGDARNGFDDLLSCGLASLMHAAEKFDFNRGYRFSTYATCAVRRDLYRYVMNRKRDSQRFSTGADELIGGSAAASEDAEELTEAAWRRLSGSLREMIAQLDERERFIVTHRFGLEGDGKRASYSRLGERLGISKERVRQLANRAMEKLREWAPEHRLEALLS